MEDTEELIRALVSSVNKLVSRESIVIERFEKILDDHEKRIRLIERFIGFGLGAIGFGSLLVQLFFKR